MLLHRAGLGLMRANISKQSISRFNNVAKPLLLRSSVSTVSASSEEEQEILVAQRRNRPTSPHLDIYQPQLTMILSGAHRVTGVVLAFGFYGITCAYTASSILGYQFDHHLLFNLIESLPVYLQYGLKSALAFPFAFHLSNGLRHYVWDMGKELTIKGIYRTGYSILVFAAIFGSALVLYK
ncbi:succinate:quinone oxidoreductase subunit C [Ascoidea rubescens DSM 1968]|uniref:Putative succinate dehydrogenase cytochrome b subunit mitochondrial n=1 Tax=Ascoidea rubescens DSM 1968 TaxID=1344418 RepID=A0A1D2VS15_9ASCO|nr:putative succinate dehydrogenase cytochrome b subunit mitochondrial precursor [Ascoidea rubescens DSM 1968]ODV64404.1 putative succinate dehydrogenase cytochrome b subunit mitochondrial precursor [Ascoidea rubescens DSM 1968]